MHGAQTVCPHPPGGPDGMPGILVACLNDSAGHSPESKSVRMLSLPQGASVAAFYRLTLEWPGLEIETSAQR
jgi:hypothetical protein